MGDYRSKWLLNVFQAYELTGPNDFHSFYTQRHKKCLFFFISSLQTSEGAELLEELQYLLEYKSRNLTPKHSLQVAGVD